MARKKRRITITSICVMAALMTAVSVSGCSGGASGSTAEIRRDVTVETVAPEIGSIIVIGEYIGVTEPDQRVTVFPKLPGEVESVNFSVGDAVREGDVLFSMNVTDVVNSIASLEAQLEVQDATVRAAQTGVSLATGSAVQSQILAASGGVQQAQAAVEMAERGMEQAQLAYDNALFVFELGEISINALEQAEMARLNAETGLEQARNAHRQALDAQRIASGQMPAENRQRAQDALAQAEAARNTLLVNLDAARERLDDASVKSPISGVVDARNVEPFGMAAPQSPAFVISDNSVVAVSFRVPRSSVPHMAVGDGIVLKDGIDEYAGTITEISTTVNAGGLFTIKAQVEGAAESIPGGASVIVMATAQRASDVPLIPLSAVHYENGVPFAYVDDHGFAKRVQLETGIFDAEHIHVISGVELGDQVISTWSARLSDGVEIVLAGGGSAE